MQFSLETSAGLERRLVITVPAADIDQQVDKRLRKISKQVRIDGFRPGKVPAKEIKRRYGLSTRHEVLGEVIQNSFVEALKQSDIKPAGTPDVEPRVNEEGKDLEFVATFEIYPEIELIDFSTINIEKLEAEVKEEDIDVMIDTLRTQQKKLEEVEEGTPAENNDTIVIDYSGTIEGVALEGGSAQDESLELGSKKMIPGFESGLVGAKAGDERVLNLVFPESYSEDLKGKAVEFTVTVKKVQKLSLPELNEEFFALFGVKEGGKERFREEVGANMKRELKQAIRSKLKKQVLDSLLKLNKVDLPDALIDQEVNVLRQNVVKQMQSADSEKEIDISHLPEKLFKKEAEKRVALGLIIGEIVSRAKMTTDEGRLRKMIEDIAAPYQNPQEIIDWYYGNEKMLNQLNYVVLEEQVVDTILDEANVIMKPCSYNEAIQNPKESEKAEINNSEVIEQPVVEDVPEGNKS